MKKIFLLCIGISLSMHARPNLKNATPLSIARIVYAHLVGENFVHSYISNYHVPFEPTHLHCLISLDAQLHKDLDTRPCWQAYDTIEGHCKELIAKLMKEKNGAMRDRYHTQKSFLREIQAHINSTLTHYSLRKKIKN